MEESTLRWPTDKEREEMEEVCSIGEVPHTEKSGYQLEWGGLTVISIALAVGNGSSLHIVLTYHGLVGKEYMN